MWHLIKKAQQIEANIAKKVPETFLKNVNEETNPQAFYVVGIIYNIVSPIITTAIATALISIYLGLRVALPVFYSISALLIGLSIARSQFIGVYTAFVLELNVLTIVFYIGLFIVIVGAYIAVALAIAMVYWRSLNN